jgi:hypothetical protein
MPFCASDLQKQAYTGVIRAAGLQPIPRFWAAIWLQSVLSLALLALHVLARGVVGDL